LVAPVARFLGKQMRAARARFFPGSRAILCYPRFSRFMKKLAVIATAVLLVGGGVFVFSKKALPTASEGIPERYIARAEKRDIDATVELTGDVMPDTQLDVKAEVGGKIKALHVAPGQQVKKGDLLVEIDDTDLLTEKASATTETQG